MHLKRSRFRVEPPPTSSLAENGGQVVTFDDIPRDYVLGSEPGAATNDIRVGLRTALGHR